MMNHNLQLYSLQNYITLTVCSEAELHYNLHTMLGEGGDHCRVWLNFLALIISSSHIVALQATFASLQPSQSTGCTREWSLC